MSSIKKLIIFSLFQNVRILKYRFLSNCKKVVGHPRLFQPAELSGKGTIVFNGTVKIGVYPSPYFFNSYAYIEARNENSIIEINDGVWINNNAVLISEGPGIKIGKNTIIGTRFEVYDSDFHALKPDLRMCPGYAAMARIEIGENVFIGSNVTILKGVHIGNNSVIGNSSIVTCSVPENVIAAGNPAKIIRSLI